MKKAIDWFALLVGVALALYGARWMWTGWDIVQAERGWTAVIAGSVMLSGGLVVATLAWAVVRLTGVSGAASRAPAEAASVAPSIKPATSDRSLAVPATVAVGAAAAGAAAAEIALPHARPDEELPSAEPTVDEPPPLQPPAPPTVGELLRMSEDRAVRESHDKIFEETEFAPPVEPPPPPVEIDWMEETRITTPLVAEPLAAPSVEPPPPVSVEDLPPASSEPEPLHVHEPLSAPEPLHVPDARHISERHVSERHASEAPHASEPLDAPEPPLAPPRSDEPVYDDWLERTAREFDRELGRDGVRDNAPEEEPAPEPPPPPKAEPAIVGRYSSGDTNYLMFADGSIEAQTPEGVMRFGSLTELKRFVEKRN